MRLWIEESLANEDAGALGRLAQPNCRLTALAERVARLADALLPRAGGILLALAIGADGALRMHWWSARFGTCAEITAVPAAFAPADSPEGALQRTAAELIGYLAGRWPANCAPATLGVITDGTGVAFSPEHPSPLDAGWLLRHCQSGAALTEILPLGENGRQLMQASRNTVAIH